MKYQLRDYQQEASDAAVRFFNDKSNRNGLLVLPTGCHARGTKILMYDGTMKNVEDVVIGDVLVGDDGKPRNVLALHRGVDAMYEVTPNKGLPFVVNGGHILSLHKTNEGKHYAWSNSRIDEISVSDYLQTSKTYKHNHKLRRVALVDFKPTGLLPLSPYFIGLYLGDGSSVGTINITTMRKEVEKYIYQFAALNRVDIREDWKGHKNKARTYHLVCPKGQTNPLVKTLKDLGLHGLTAGFKFIPHVYKCADYENRLYLLAGLLDTDAYYENCRNEYEYCTKSVRLADDVVFLCRSLGFYCSDKSAKVVNGQTYYRMVITGDLNIIPTKVAIRKGKPRKQKKNHRVTCFAVKYVGRGDYYGFTIDGNHLYCDGQFFVHHNSGKSLVIADIAHRLNSNVLVFQPNKEILSQNYDKSRSYGVSDCSIYSASFNSKEISRITFATIGSVKLHHDDFKQFKYVIVDEAHVCNAQGGMYSDFFESAERKILGLTATPYRLNAQQISLDENGKYNPEFEPQAKCILKFLTRTRPRIFHDVIYQVEIATLLQRGYLARLRYFDLSIVKQSNVKRNSTGMDFDDTSLGEEYRRVSLKEHLVDIVRRLQHPKDGVPRKGILVFTKYLEESEWLCSHVYDCAMVSGDTPKKERDRILSEFKAGMINVVTNVGILTTGFDYPELDTVVMARPTMSLALWYQIVGRIIRPHPSKECGWVVDLCGNIQRFGKVEDLRLQEPRPHEYIITGASNGAVKQLTNVWF